jgi:DNA modification methylase
MIINGDCLYELTKIESNSIDLILTDPPIWYHASRVRNTSDNANDEIKLKYGKISIDFGDWDKVEIDWNLLFKEYYRVLKRRYCNIFLWYMESNIIKVAELNKFKQPRIGQWVK